MGKIVERSILDYVENSFSGNIPYPSLITLLCIKGGVTFSETKDKCPRSSTFTLTRALKTPALGEEVERATKGKRAYTNLQREAAPAVEKEPETEEREGFEYYPEQLMLSPSLEENFPAQNRVERGKRRAKE